MYTAEKPRATGNRADGPRRIGTAFGSSRLQASGGVIKNEQAFHISDSYKPYRIHWNQLAGVASKVRDAVPAQHGS